MKMREMEKKKAINLLNSLEIHDYDADGECLYFALVKVNDHSEKIIKSLLPKGVVYEDGLDAIKGELFDLTLFCWEYAEWFNGDIFLAERPDFE